MSTTTWLVTGATGFVGKVLLADLIRLRREDPTLRAPARGSVDGAVLAEHAFVLRFFARDGADRLLVVNFGAEVRLEVAPEPLLAPPEEHRWSVLWSSQDPAYGGSGAWEPETEAGWRLPGEAAVLLKPEPSPRRDRRSGRERRR